MLLLEKHSNLPALQLFQHTLKSAMSLRAPRSSVRTAEAAEKTHNAAAYVKLNGRASPGRITVLNAIFTVRRGDPCRFTNGDSVEGAK